MVGAVHKPTRFARQTYFCDLQALWRVCGVQGFRATPKRGASHQASDPRRGAPPIGAGFPNQEKTHAPAPTKEQRDPRAHVPVAEIICRTCKAPVPNRLLHARQREIIAHSENPERPLDCAYSFAASMRVAVQLEPPKTRIRPLSISPCSASTHSPIGISGLSRCRQ